MNVVLIVRQIIRNTFVEYFKVYTKGLLSDVLKDLLFILIFYALSEFFLNFLGYHSVISLSDIYIK
jgi:hypothetical protein